MRKGQSRYIVGVGVMVFAVSFYALNSWAMSYVLTSAVADMDQNFARYESAVHSYMVINDDGSSPVNNKINENNLAANLTQFSSYDSLCYFDGDLGWNHPDEYKMTFYSGQGLNTITGSGECTPDNYADLEYPGGLTSYGLLMLPMYFPMLQFYGTNNDKIYYVQTRVEP